MPKKQNIDNEIQKPTKPMDIMENEDSDNELEYVEKSLLKTKETQQVDGATKPTVALPLKMKQKRNITEEHKVVLRERLKVAHQRNQELAEERRKAKELQDLEFQKEKESKILEQAQKLKQKQMKELKKIEVKTKPQEAPIKKKKPTFIYVDSDEDNEADNEDDEEDEEPQQIIVKPKKKVIKQPDHQQAVFQQIAQPSFLKFI